MQTLITRVERLIKKHEGYIRNLSSIDMTNASESQKIANVQRMEDHAEMIAELIGIKQQLKYADVL